MQVVHTGHAYADYAATPYDLVGIGGDTPQFTLDLLSNGDPDGDLGFNATGGKRRLLTFDAEADSNGRGAYFGPNNSGNAALNAADPGLALDPTQVLVGGENPTQRTSSSGNAITSLENDTAGDINFIASTTALSGTSYAVPLHEFEFGTDEVELAAGSTTDAPANLTKAQLASIYEGATTNWSSVGGTSATIIPELPPSTSAIAKTFLSAIGITTAQLGTDVVTVEQNDPNAVTLASTPAAAIVPFSLARFNLLKGSSSYGTSPGPSAPYFPATPGASTFVSADAGITYPAQPAYSPAVQLLASAATTTVTDYIDVRQSDLTDTSNSSAIEPGSAVNWANYLFGGGTVTPYIESPAGQALILESGVTPVYADKGEFS